MDRTGTDNPVLHRVLAAAPAPCLLTGPAGCGKTSTALAVVEHYRDEAAQPNGWLLAPNAPTAADLRRKLLQRSPDGVLVAPPVLSFRALAERILAATSDGPAPVFIDPLRRHLLLQRVVADLHRKRQLKAFHAVADTPGLVASLARAISELKRAAADPADLDTALASAHGKTHDLLAVYRQYQQHLQAHDRYDAAGQLWQVRDALAARPDAPVDALGLAGMRALVVDGFTDFTPTQLQILAALAGRIETLLITLPWADDGRDRMWQWTARTRTILRAAFDPALQDIALPPADVPRGGPAAMAAQVFRYDSTEPAEPDGLAVIEAASIDAEAAAVARRVKRLLVAGAPVGSIAVLARTPDAYRPAIERAFRECDIPIAPASKPLAALPPVRFLLAAAELPDSDFAGHNVLAVIKNSYFQPAALGRYDDRTVAVADMMIREGNVYAGRICYRHAAERLARRIGQNADIADDEAVAGELGPLQATEDDLRAAADMLDALFECVARPDEPPTQRLPRLLDALQMRSAVCRSGEAETVARDLRALDRLEAVLDDDSWPDDPALLREALRQVALPPPRDESLVDVLSVLDARGLRWQHVFLLGCSEGQFPPSFREHALLGEADRREWIDRGIALDRRSDLTAREMLLFYLAVTRAEASITFSYPAADTGAAAARAGPFLEAAVECLGGMDALRAHDSAFHRIPPGALIPPADEIASPRDALAAGLAGQFSPDAEPNPGALAWARYSRPEVLRRVCMGIWAGHRRWRRGPCNEFDGRLDDPSLLATLARRYPQDVEFSASRLSTFGQCGWHYFGRYICRLEPLVQPQRQLEPVARGLFTHNLLYRVYRRLAETHGRPLRLWQLDEATVTAALDAAFEAECSRIEAAEPPYPALWDIQRQQLRADALGYLQAEREDRYNLQAECLHVELAFGGAGRGGDLCDPASTAEAVTVETSAGPIQLAGKIDRIDRVHFGDLTGLLVIDYKTGALPKADEALDGTNVQMPLYAAAVRTLKPTGEPCLGGAFHGVTAEAPQAYFAAMRLARKTLAANPAFDEQYQLAMDRIGEFVEAMRAGRFDLLPHPETARYDDFREADHYSPARAEVKEGTS
ncbi:MAG: hypothetical protein GVY16_08685 [Planctomycetes bacterium]|nr:hypothetical protein [Planctomycetota bacterium]